METLLGQKPYKFIPLNKNIVRDGAKNQNLYSGKFEISIKTLTPIHIGQGTVHIEEGKVIHDFMRKNGEIVIPGSSFKGMIRSIFEAASESCSPSLPNNNKDLEKGLPNETIDICSKIDNLCPTCSVFGIVNSAQCKKSKLRFSEFVLVDSAKDKIKNYSLPRMESPFKDYPKINNMHSFRNKKGYGNERLYYADLLENEEDYDNFDKDTYYRMIQNNEHRSIKFRGRKFYLHNINNQEQSKNDSEKFEMVEKDNIFKGQLIFEGLTRYEMSILAYILSFGTNDDFKYKIGYGKPAYFGSIKINVDSIHKYHLCTQEISEEILTNLADEYFSNASDNLKEILEKLKLILSNLTLGNSWPVTGGIKSY